MRAEAEAILHGADRVGDEFATAVEWLVSMDGRLVTVGVGKSGHIANKVSATFASTGTPSQFLHAAEAAHGDLGVLRPGDIALVFSHSGETAEILALLPHLEESEVRIIALTDGVESTLARNADLVLSPMCEHEADPFGLAPTSSTTAALAYGDALAIATAEARGFTVEEFHRVHPGGALGEAVRRRLEGDR
jgi:arabinose-5-phosphate isomerase